METAKYLSEILTQAKQLSAPVAAVPTMVTVHEQQFLRLLSQEYYSGKGAIFDGGCFIGGCTQSFAQGLANREIVPKDTVLHVYEYGVCCEYESDFLRAYGLAELALGESFVHLLEENLSHCPGSEFIELHIGDILEQSYPESIEILFLDVCKVPNINHSMQMLLERGIPGRTVVIHQDYIYEWLPWIHVSAGFLSQYLEPIGVVGGSFVWLLGKNVPASLARCDVWNVLTLAEKIDCMGRYYRHLTPHERWQVDLAKAVLLAHHGVEDDARKQIALIRDSVENLNIDNRAYCLQRCDEIEKGVTRICQQQALPLCSPGIFSIESVREVRQRACTLGYVSLTSQKYQDDIAFCVANNMHYGDALLEVGCFRGGLTVQLAHMAKTLGKRVHVVDISEEYLNVARKIVTGMGYEDVVSFYCMNFRQFAENILSNSNYIVSVIDASHFYHDVYDDCRVLRGICKQVHASIFHDFTLHAYDFELRVNDAIFDVFGSDVRYYPVGAHVALGDIPNFSVSRVSGGEYYCSGTEGVLIYGQDMEKEEQISLNCQVVQNIPEQEVVIEEKIVHVVDPVLQENINMLEEYISNLHGSMSWKITMPLRWIGRILK